MSEEGALTGFKAGITALILVALIAAAIGLALDSFQGEMPSSNACVDSTATFNSTSRVCYGGTTTNTTTAAFNSTEEGLEGLGNATSYLSTIGTLIGVAALIAVVVAAFYFVGRR